MEAAFNQTAPLRGKNIFCVARPFRDGKKIAFPASHPSFSNTMNNIPNSQKKPPVAATLVEKLRNSREFSISVLIHIIFVALFGGTVLFQAAMEPPDFEGEGGFVTGGGEQVTAPAQPVQQMPQTQDITVTATPVNTSQLSAITTTATSPMNFNMTQMVMAPQMPVAPTATQMAAPKPTGPPAGAMGGISPSDASAIREFTGGWGKGTGSGTGNRKRVYDFTAYLAKYDGGNWWSTVQGKYDGDSVKDGAPIVRGSLPNLLAFMNNLSDPTLEVKTNYNRVQAIKLDSQDLFATKPPFIFITGTRDFTLTQTEVDNLRKYLRLGGAIWGDSSVPGRNSRFDIAFRREMRRVIPDKDKDWEELPKDHEIFNPAKAFFKDVSSAPPGLNFYEEPVYVLRIYGSGTKADPGKIAIIYTSNDYGDMWQIGVKDGKIMNDMAGGDMNDRGNWVAMNPALWHNREVYVKNISYPALEKTYRFGTNMVLHLLTRWDSLKGSGGPSL